MYVLLMDMDPKGHMVKVDRTFNAMLIAAGVVRKCSNCGPHIYHPARGLTWDSMVKAGTKILGEGWYQL